MWPSWQPGPGLHTHVTPNLELPSHDQRPGDGCQHPAPAQIKTNTKLSCQNFRFNDLPVATAGDAGGEKLGRVPSAMASCLRGLVSANTSWSEDAAKISPNPNFPSL